MHIEEEIDTYDRVFDEDRLSIRERTYVHISGV
jgi:hypothetical protein